MTERVGCIPAMTLQKERQAFFFHLYPESQSWNEKYNYSRHSNHCQCDKPKPEGAIVSLLLDSLFTYTCIPIALELNNRVKKGSG